jgi:hypothetical protein
MNRKNFNNSIAPQVVLWLSQALERKLGRPTYIRQVKSSNEWFITDPMFSFVQYGLRKGATGYRVGYFFSVEEDLVAFYLTHSPIMSQLFKKNLKLSSLIHAVEKTISFRSTSFLQWSSRFARKNGEKRTIIEEMIFPEFLVSLRYFDEKHGFVHDLFPRIENQKTGIGPAKWAGNDFFLLLAEKASKLRSKDFELIVDSSWPLFLCLYPIEAIENRIASLARSLNTAKLLRRVNTHT